MLATGVAEYSDAYLYTFTRFGQPGSYYPGRINAVKQPSPSATEGNADLDAAAAIKAKHIAYAEERNRSITRARAARKAALRQSAPAIEKALAAYRTLDHGEHPEIRIRREFVRLAEPRPAPEAEVPYKERRAADLASRPPLTKLIHRKSNALALYLTAIYIAHLEQPPGAAVPNTHHNTFRPSGYGPAWATLAGMHDGASQTVRHRRMHRALAELSKYDLIAAGPATTGRFRDWTLRSEDGADRSYEVPGEGGPRAATIRIPAWFFFQGWHLVLEPREVAVFLMIVDFAQSMPRQPQFGIAPSTRDRHYGLPLDTYSESVHELHDFGLIDLHDPMANRGHGKIADRDEPLVTYQLRCPSTHPRNKTIAERPAVEVVLGDLDHDLPGRLYEMLLNPRNYLNLSMK